MRCRACGYYAHENEWPALNVVVTRNVPLHESGYGCGPTEPVVLYECPKCASVRSSLWGEMESAELDKDAP